MKTSDQDYIQRAIDILADEEQTSYSKGIAKELLRNVGFSEREINEFKTRHHHDGFFVMVA